MSTVKIVPFSGTRKASGGDARLQKQINLFGGRTLDEVGFINGLGSDDVKFFTNPLPKGGVIRLLKVVIGSEAHYIPMSRAFGPEQVAFAKANPDWFLRCEFRAGNMSVKNADGTPKTDEMGNVVLDEKRPYLSFGKPSGIDYSNGTEEDAFEPLTEEQIAALNMGHKDATIPA